METEVTSFTTRVGGGEMNHQIIEVIFNLFLFIHRFVPPTVKKDFNLRLNLGKSRNIPVFARLLVSLM